MLVEQPLGISIPELAISKLRNNPIKKAMKWHPNEKVLLYYTQNKFLLTFLDEV